MFLSIPPTSCHCPVRRFSAASVQHSLSDRDWASGRRDQPVSAAIGPVRREAGQNPPPLLGTLRPPTFCYSAMQTILAPSKWPFDARRQAPLRQLVAGGAEQGVPFGP